VMPGSGNGASSSSSRPSTADSGGSSTAVAQAAVRHGVTLPRRGKDDGAGAEEMKPQR
jgi:hypothetical protein